MSDKDITDDEEENVFLQSNLMYNAAEDRARIHKEDQEERDAIHVDLQSRAYDERRVNRDIRDALQENTSIAENNRQASHDKAVSDLQVLKEHLKFQDEHLERQDKSLERIEDKMDRNLMTLSDRMQAYISNDDMSDAALQTSLAENYAKKQDVKDVANKIDTLSYKIGGAMLTALFLMAGWIYYAIQHVTAVSH